MKTKDKDIGQARTDTVLVMDESSAALELVTKILMANKQYPLKAESTEQAFKILQTIKPDLILLEVTIQGASGFDFCKAIKREEDIKDIPVIFLTARPEPETAVEAFKAGAVDFIRKPFNPDELLQRIRAHIDIVRKGEKIAKENSELMKQVKELTGFKETVSQDAMRLVALNNKLADNEENLRKTNKTKDKFFSIIAHDLKNPLQAVMGLSEMLAFHIETMTKEKTSLFAHDIFESVTRLSKLLENLLQWSRVQTGNIPFKPEVIDIQVLADNVVKQYSISARAKNIRLLSTVPADEFAFGDEQMVMTILRNLISNAIKFTHEGGQVMVSTLEDRNLVFIDVADNGVGISAQKIEKMFKLDQHISTQGTANEEGTGLGLILCKDFVEMNGGRITVESEPGKGTRFRFYLPRFAAETGN